MYICVYIYIYFCTLGCPKLWPLPTRLLSKNIGKSVLQSRSGDDSAMAIDIHVDKTHALRSIFLPKT